jgi:hypothetical protein
MFVFYMGLARLLNYIPFVRTLKYKSLLKEIGKLNLFRQDYELRALQIEEFLREEPFEVKNYLQNRIFDLPLTKSLKPDYSSESSD